MNQSAVIQVQYVNPRNGKRPPSIKDSSGIFYTVDDDALAYFREGQQGEIEFFTNAKGYNVATDWMGSKLPRRQAAPHGVQQIGQVAQQGMPSQPQDAPPYKPAPELRDVDKEESIFVTGVVGRAMGSGSFHVGDIDALTKAAVKAWRDRHKDDWGSVGQTDGSQGQHPDDPPLY